MKITICQELTRLTTINDNNINKNIDEIYPDHVKALKKAADPSKHGQAVARLKNNARAKENHNKKQSDKEKIEEDLQED